MSNLRYKIQGIQPNFPAGRNRAQRRAATARARQWPAIEKRQFAKDTRDHGVDLRRARIEKHHALNRINSAKRREAAKKL